MGRCRSIRRPAHRVSTSSTNGMVAARFRPADASGPPPLAGRARRDPVTRLWALPQHPQAGPPGLDKLDQRDGRVGVDRLDQRDGGAPYSTGGWLWGAPIHRKARGRRPTQFTLVLGSALPPLTVTFRRPLRLYIDGEMPVSSRKKNKITRSRQVLETTFKSNNDGRITTWASSRDALSTSISQGESCRTRTQHPLPRPRNAPLK
jgi:hypothetical protein